MKPSQIRLIQSLTALGFTADEIAQLRRIERTLHRWAEAECGDSNDWASWSIERDESTEKPFRVTHPHSGGKPRREAIADRETGALKRLARIVAERNKRARESDGPKFPDPDRDVIYYHQTDPRGAAVYLLRSSDLRTGEQLDSVYSRGLAIAD